MSAWHWSQPSPWQTQWLSQRLGHQTRRKGRWVSACVAMYMFTPELLKGERAHYP